MIEEPEEIIELFLEASGIKKPEKRKEYQKKLDDIILDFKSVNPDVLNQDSIVIIERLFDYMYGKKQYVVYNSSPFLNEVIDAFLDDSNKGGIGDCVGISAFYASLASKLGVHLNVYFKHRHVFLVARNNDGKDVIIETTRKDGFNSFLSNNEKYRRLPLRSLAASLYYNRWEPSLIKEFCWELMIKVGELITKKASYLGRLRGIPKKKLLKKIFDVCPNYSPALYSKARALSLRDRVQEGILLLERERERELQPGICDYFIAEILYEQKSYDQAMQFVERAISAEEEDANYHITKGEILRKIDKEFDGFISFMRGYNIHATNQEQGEKVKAAKLIMESNTFLDEKTELLEKIGVPNPSSSILYVLGHLYEKKGNFEKADSAYKQFYDIDTSDDLLYTQIGNRYHERELFDEARTFYKRARELEPNKKKYMKLYANTFFVEHRYKLYLDEYRQWHQRIGSAKWRIKRDLIICKANMAMEDFFLRAEAKYRDAP